MYSYSSVSSDDLGRIYYDITITSTRTEDTGINDPPVKFIQSRTQAVISDCSLYDLTIVRFTMDGCGSDLPMWIPTIMPLAQQQSMTGFTAFDPNKTIYAVTINGSKSGANAGSTAYLEWTSETSGALPSSQKYYYSYTYSHFCDLFNTAVASAFTNVSGQLGGVTTKAPQLVYNGSTNLFSLYCDSNGFGPDRTSQTESFNIVFDANLYQLLRNFENIYTPNNQPETNEIIVRNRLNNTQVVGGTTYYVVTQDFPSTDAIWSPVQSIVFTTSLLPVVPEQVGAPIVIANGMSSDVFSSQANFQTTITDVALPISRSSDYKGFMEYAPNPYRMISMSTAKQEIREFDVSVFWKDKSGTLYPVTLPNGASVSLKLLFKMKGLP